MTDALPQQYREYEIIMSDKPAPVTVGIVPSTTMGHVLFIERADGGLALPGGYLEKLEDTSTALTRESFEEMDLELEPHKWRLFHSVVTPCNKLILFSHYVEPVDLPRNFESNDEVLRVLAAPWNTPLVFASHEEALKLWASSSGLAPLQLRPRRVLNALQPIFAQRSLG